MNKQELTAMVAEILGQMGLPEPMVKGSDYKPENPGPVQKENGFRAGDFVPDVTALDLRKLYLQENAADKEAFARLKAKTPARLGSGRAGPRYKTLTMLRFRADHAAAQDAVFSQVAEDFGEKNGLLPLKTHCQSQEEYLTRPDRGRVLDEESSKLLKSTISAAPRVQIVVGDGLSSAAISANAMDWAAAIREGSTLIRVGTGIFGARM